MIGCFVYGLILSLFSYILFKDANDKNCKGEKGLGWFFLIIAIVVLIIAICGAIDKDFRKAFYGLDIVMLFSSLITIIPFLISRKKEQRGEEHLENYFRSQSCFEIRNGNKYLIRRSSDIDIKDIEYILEGFYYKNETPYYRTIAFKNAATTELVDNRGWYRNTFYNVKTGKYYLRLNKELNEEPISILYLDNSLVDSAKKANLPHLCFDKKNSAYLDFSDQTGLLRDLYLLNPDGKNVIDVPKYMKIQKQFVESNTNYLVSKEEGEKIIRWMKGYDN